MSTNAMDYPASHFAEGGDLTFKRAYGLSHVIRVRRFLNCLEKLHFRVLERRK